MAGTVAVNNGSNSVVGTNTSFLEALTKGQSLVFASDPTLTAYQIASIGGDLALTLTANYTGPPSLSTSASVVVVASGTGTVAVNNGSAAVAGTGTTFTQTLTVGQSIVFSTDPTNTIYQIAAIGGDTSLTLTRNYAGSNSSSATSTLVNSVAMGNYGIQFNCSSPTTPPSPLPITVSVSRKARRFRKPRQAWRHNCRRQSTPRSGCRCRTRRWCVRYRESAPGRPSVSTRTSLNFPTLSLASPPHPRLPDC